MQAPFSTVIQHEETTGLIRVLIQGATSNFKHFEELYRALHRDAQLRAQLYADANTEHSDLHNAAIPVALHDDGSVTVAFPKVNRYGIVVSQGFCRIAVAFPSTAREIMLPILASLAYIHFEKNQVRVGCDDEWTLSHLLEKMRAQEMVVMIEQALLEKMIALEKPSKPIAEKVDVATKHKSPITEKKRANENTDAAETPVKLTQLSATHIPNTISSPFSLTSTPETLAEPSAPPSEPSAPPPKPAIAKSMLPNNQTAKQINNAPRNNNPHPLINDRTAVLNRFLNHAQEKNQHNNNGAAPAA